VWVRCAHQLYEKQYAPRFRGCNESYNTITHFSLFVTAAPPCCGYVCVYIYTYIRTCDLLAPGTRCCVSIITYPISTLGKANKKLLPLVATHRVIYIYIYTHTHTHRSVYIPAAPVTPCRTHPTPTPRKVNHYLFSFDEEKFVAGAFILLLLLSLQ